MEVSLIAAMDETGGIGYKGRLPWPVLYEDFKNFSSVTSGSIVIMGRKTWDSLPEKFKPLPGRLNLVLTKDSHRLKTRIIKYDKPNYFATLKGTLIYAIAQADSFNRDIFIIGGAAIYKEALETDIIDRMYITLVKDIYPADVFFPPIDTIAWEKVFVDSIEPTQKAPGYTFHEFKRKRNNQNARNL